MPDPLVLVTETEYRRSEPTFSVASGVHCVPAPSSEDALSDAVTRHGARYVVVGSVPYRDRLYRTLPRGGVVARYGVGHDSIDKAKATESGVLCTNTPDVLQQSVAEVTMAMIGAAARHILPMSSTFSGGRWAPRQGVELAGKTLAIIGCGAIGRATARIAAAGYGMRVVGFRRRSGATASPEEYFAAITGDFAVAVRDADFVSLHIPASPENLQFLDRDRLGLMQPHAWLINTARGAVVDERAMYDALAEGRLAGAALDVFEREPYAPADPSRDLRSLSNVILLPHVGSNTREANHRMAERALENIRLADAGKLSSMDLLTPEVLTLNTPRTA